MGQEDALEKGMAINSSILAWKIPWMEENSMDGGAPRALLCTGRKEADTTE